MNREPTFAELARWVRHLEPLDGVDGYLVRMSADGCYRIEIHAMLYNWRICWVPVRCQWSVDRAWCYFGIESVSFIKAVMAALIWDGDPTTEPPGYDKRVGQDYAEMPW